MQMEVMSAMRMQADSKIMFTDSTNMAEPMKNWVEHKKKEILQRDGLFHPHNGDDAPLPSI
jgi:hypothetical protein